MRWYVDGKHFQLCQDDWFTDADNAETDHSPFDQRFHIILNLAIGGKWPEEAMMSASSQWISRNRWWSIMCASINAQTARAKRVVHN